MKAKRIGKKEKKIENKKSSERAKYIGMIILFYKEEETQDENFLTKAGSILHKKPSKTQSRFKKEYKELYSQEKIEETTNCFFEGDDFFEKYHQEYGDFAPLNQMTSIGYKNNSI